MAQTSYQRVSMDSLCRDGVNTAITLHTRSIKTLKCSHFIAFINGYRTAYMHALLIAVFSFEISPYEIIIGICNVEHKRKFSKYVTCTQYQRVGKLSM